ncbi:MAG: helix-turn-helix transcriptional regulator [Aminobacterium sp.]|jgi:transcriptional regulator with XRE-family HTH domain|uniref:HTH cro/C1-type domain-containing protein n=1 Tax=bioreactor metagenome TaxID=1076179 RepID=A0A644ZG71_9ZZZZ|nr:MULTISPECIES: helix-turn-helix transcriptional regulator [unclassified Aminobacterium]MDD2206755.1 helix-turn-helix transcriptional regulator [Aminobacterium sp.]MDD3426912.1 helix-turn-helix transcriptional regulator [Aminobacterium sp.]MDD3707799.1 helix-turn-helix transcriptional regulator [Aminobacterium sp.]MDD4229135.1 helix-turn-helix transcriptional regulator [Aminobacterium sp.]MDD4552063.1 helix-turn-helix transcriptional regulator [Aminobacterium sp.]
MSLGIRIKTLRKAARLTQQALADKTDVSRIYIQALESNRRLPSMKLLAKLAQALDVEITDLVKGAPSDEAGRVHLEEVLENAEDVEIWYKSYRFSKNELSFIKQIIEATVSFWQNENIDQKG